MPFFQFFINIYKNMSYQNKLIASYSVFLLLPIVILSLYSYKQIAEVNTKQSITVTDMYLDQAETSLNYQLSIMANTALTLAQQPTLKEIIDQDPALISTSQQYADYKTIREIIYAIGETPNVYQIRVYVNEEFIYSRNQSYIYNIMDIIEEDWLQMVNEYYAGVYISPLYNFEYWKNTVFQTMAVTSAVAPIRSDTDMNDIIGFVTVDMLKADLLSFIDEIALTKNTGAFILNNNNEVICSSGAVSQDYLDLISSNTLTFDGSNYSTIINNEYIAGVSGVIWNSWHIVVLTPVDDFMETAAELRNSIIFFAAIVGILIYFVAFFYAKYNARRILSLAKQMSGVEKGNFNGYCTVDSSDEIGELQSTFNTMVRKINSLMKEQYYLGKNLKGTELKVLQAQINPHFLYNTMDLILWTAKNGDTDQVCDIVLKLSKFYRIALSKGSDFIPIEKEIEHIQLYTELQNLRFGKKILFKAKIEPEVSGFKIMKLLLQPIVENAILHGIMDKDDGQGEIWVSAYLYNHDLCIEIKDNGIGMDHNKLMHIVTLDNIKKLSEGSYGLQNIIQRLKVHYDSEADIRFFSTPGVGTTVVVRISAHLCQGEEG